MNLLNIFGSIFGGVDKITKSVIGSKQERDQQSHDEFTQVQNSYQAEYTNTGGFFNSLVDGINRLVRPIYTLGTVYMFYWAFSDPIPFKNAMSALKAIPLELWIMMGTVTTFWFGSKSVFGDRHKYNYKAPKIIEKVVTERQVIDDDDTPSPQKNIDLNNVDNDVIRKWLLAK